MKSKRKAYGLLLILAGTAMLAGCILLIRKNMQESDDAAVNAAAALAALAEQIPEQPETIQLPELYRQSKQQTLSETDFLTSDHEMKVLSWNGDNYIGILTVPALGLKLPVFAEWDYSRLRSGPCRYYGTTGTHDLVIAGHNYTSVFGRLQSLSPGDAVSLTDADGHIIRYTVGEIEILRPDAVAQMTESNWPLTLYTCTYSGTERVTVRCAYAKNQNKETD